MDPALRSGLDRGCVEHRSEHRRYRVPVWAASRRYDSRSADPTPLPKRTRPRSPMDARSVVQVRAALRDPPHSVPVGVSGGAIGERMSRRTITMLCVGLGVRLAACGKPIVESTELTGAGPRKIAVFCDG